MPFPFDKYPWLNFQELNLAYFIKHFREIFEQWNTLLNEMYEWKDATNAELEEWKSTVETGISSWETGLQQSMEAWKDETEADISAWETATLAALDTWKTATTAVFEQIRTEASASAQAAAGSAADAQTALAGAQAAQAAAEAAAAGIQSELTQIQTNTTDISDLKTQLGQEKNAIGVIGEVTFSVNATESHSSTKDKILCNIKSGDTFYITLSENSNVIMGTLFGWKNDGTSVSLGSYTMNGTRRNFVAANDYVAIGLYVNAQPAQKTYTMLLDMDNSIVEKLNSTKTTLETKIASGDSRLQTEINQGKDTIGIIGKVNFTVNSGNTHSSGVDQILCDIKQGEKFYLTITKSGNTNILCTPRGFFSDGTGVNLPNYQVDGTRREITADYDFVAIGIYMNAISATQSYTVLLDKNNSILENIKDIEGKIEVTDTIKRGNIFKNSSKNFLFFTDVHGSSGNVNKIVEYANKYQTDLSFVLNGGDTVGQYLDDGISWYDTIVDTCDIDILTTVGNHDVWGSALYDKLPATTVYNSFIKPVAQKVDDIIQPVNAETDGKCYYYKDYGDIRVIILNAMSGIASVTYWDTDAKTWLETVLSDAKANNKHVLCVNHAPFTSTDRVLNSDSQWTSFKPYFDGTVLEPEAVTAVQNFIDNEGVFIGWLVGHTHNDAVMANNNGQFMFASATAHYVDSYFHSDGYGKNSDNDITYNCFNVCGVDTTNKIFKMIRIGWDMDSAMKKRDAFSYDYGQGKIITDRG